MDLLRLLGIDRGYLGVSVGSSNITMSREHRGLVLSEPSVIAFETYTDKVVAIGRRAKDMIGKTPDTITTAQPMQHGVISNYKFLTYMLKAFVSKANRRGFGEKMVIAVPAAASVVERRAVVDAARMCGCRKIHLIENCLAAAIGCGININEPKGQMVVDIGGGKTEIGVVCLGDIVNVTTLDVCGEQFNRDIVNYVKNNFNILIGTTTAESAKEKIGCVTLQKRKEFLNLGGRDVVSGLPANFMLSNEDVYNALKDSVSSVIDGISSVIEKLPPDLTQDIVKGQIHICGGCALLKGWSDLILDTLCIECETDENAPFAIATGAAKSWDVVERLEKNKRKNRIRKQ